MCFKIILKVTKSQDFTLSLEDTCFEKPQGRGSQTGSPPQAILGLNTYQNFWYGRMKDYFIIYPNWIMEL